MLGSGGLGGDEVSGVRVDVVEVGVVVIVVVGVVRRHLLDAGGDAPHRLYVRLRGRPAPLPPLFAPPSPRGSRAPSCLPPGAHAALFLALGSLPGPHAFVSLSTPRVPPTVTCALACAANARILPVPCPCPWLHPHSPTVPRPTPCAPWPPALAPCGRPCVSFPCPCPFPAPCPASCRPLPVLCPPPLPLASAPCPRLCPRSLLRAPRPVPCACLWALPLSPPVPRCAILWPAPCPACVLSPPSRITRWASCCGRSCGSVTPGGVRSGAGGQRGRGRPVGKAALGGYGLGGLVWVWLGLLWARYFAPSLPSAAAAAAPGQAPGAHAGATPRAGGVPGAAVGAAARLAGAAVSAPFAPGAPSRGGAAGLAARAAGVVSSAGEGHRVDGSMSAGAAWGCPAGGPTGTAASASRCSSRSVRVSAAHPGETGERERDRRWWQSSRWGEPSESNITVILVGMRGGRGALSTTSWCICGARWAVLCSAPQGRGGEGRGGRRCH